MPFRMLAVLGMILMRVQLGVASSEYLQRPKPAILLEVLLRQQNTCLGTVTVHALPGQSSIILIK